MKEQLESLNSITINFGEQEKRFQTKTPKKKIKER